MSIKRIHYFSGIIISVFIAMHLFNHLYSIFGAEKHIAMMNNLRYFYRNIFIESILLIAVFTQIYTGIRVFLSKRTSAITFFEKLQIWSGLYLSLFFLIHVSAIMVGRFILKLDTNFYFGVAGINAFPYNLFFIPYYSLAILSFFAHIASIHAQKMKSKILGMTPARQSYIFIGIGALLTLVIFYGLTNQFKGVSIPDEYQVLIGK